MLRLRIMRYDGKALLCVGKQTVKPPKCSINAGQHRGRQKHTPYSHSTSSGIRQFVVLLSLVSVLASRHVRRRKLGEAAIETNNHTQSRHNEKSKVTCNVTFNAAQLSPCAVSSATRFWYSSICTYTKSHIKSYSHLVMRQVHLCQDYRVVS